MSPISQKNILPQEFIRTQKVTNAPNLIGSLKDKQVGLILIVSLLTKFSTLETDFYEKLYEEDIEVQDREPYKTFVVPFDTNKLNLFMRN